MGEIGWSGFRSNGRNSMGEIGLGAIRVSEIFLEITPKSSGGAPHEFERPQGNLDISTPQHTTREMGSASAQGLPRNIYK